MRKSCLATSLPALAGAYLHADLAVPLPHSPKGRGPSGNLSRAASSTTHPLCGPSAALPFSGPQFTSL